VAAWVAVNVYLSDQSCVPLPPVAGIDKSLHLIEYAVLAFLLARALFPSLRRHPAFRRWAFVVLSCSLYGIFDEAHQAFVPNRSCDPLDVVADAAGAVLVAIVLLALRRRPWVGRAGVD
jgi:VanZ family protein